jgi:TRAP-type C4-dicarboxylate transport system substrate-binding protein
MEYQLNVKGEDFIIKFATLAPEGSTWLNVMNKLNNDIQKSTDGKLKFRIYSGGVFGDEKDVLKKVRFGQVHCAGFTGNGLGEILPEIRILELPYLFLNYNEIDYVSEKFYDRFARLFEERGFVLLGWTEVGFVYVFTNSPIKTIDDVRKLKRMWVWEGDPLAEETFKSFGVNPIPLPFTDFLTSLQTGLIDGVYTSPYAAIALQWFTKTKYMMVTPMTDASGALLIDKKFFNKLSPDFQNILKEKCRSYMKELVNLSRNDNEKSIETLKKNGIQVVELSENAKKEFEKIGVEVRNKLTGKLYSKEFLNEILTALDDFRKGTKK